MSARNLFLDQPHRCVGCGATLTRKQFAKWWYARGKKAAAAPGPWCSKSCFKVDDHLAHPEQARQWGLRAAAARLASGKCPKLSFIATCALPPGPERDKAMYAAGYHAGREATRRARRRETAAGYIRSSLVAEARW